MKRKLPAILIIMFLYSGLMKWINIGVDLTLISFSFVFLLAVTSKKKDLLKSYLILKKEVNIILFFGILYSLTAVYTLSLEYYLQKIAYLWIAIFSFLLPIIFLDKESKLNHFLKTFNLFSILTILILAYLLITSKWYIFNTLQDDYLNTPNYLAVGTLLGVFIICNFKKKLSLFSLIAFVFMILLSGRGPIIALFLVYFFYMIVNSQKSKKLLSFLILISLFYLGYNEFSSSEDVINTTNRFISIIDDSNPRYNQIVQAFNIIEEDLFLGVGIGGYGMAAANIDEFWHPHNLILEIFSESGFFITLLFLYFLFKIFISNNLKSNFSNEKITFILISIYLFSQAMKSGGIEDMRVTFFWFGLMTYVIKRYKNEEISFFK